MQALGLRRSDGGCSVLPGDRSVIFLDVRQVPCPGSATSIRKTSSPAHIFEAWRRVALRYGFEEYDGPPLESLELYTARAGTRSSGSSTIHGQGPAVDVALRPEMTPSWPGWSRPEPML